ncbi:MAG: hypothetical protein Q4A75_00185 [Peptostreptococcaceae bacterium]|nr:hypothetical protein [Peptostreptococcaceae bacterium]
MHDFYMMERWVRIGISFLGLITLISQAIHIVFASKRIDRKNYRIRQLFEYTVLGNVLILATIPPMLNFILRDGFLPSTVLGRERVIAFLCLCVITLLRVAIAHEFLPIVNLPAMIPMMPNFETLLGKGFFVYYGFLMVYFLARNIYFIQEDHRMIRQSISVWSIKEALDSLRSGILFCQHDGSTLLINRRMKKLMNQFGGGFSNDGLKWFEDLDHYAQCPVKSGSFDEKRAVLSFDGKVFWHFTKERLEIGNKIYWQIVATDVTERWDLVRELEEQDRLLRNKSIELNHMISNMFQIQREQEKNRLRGKLHDVLSQRITLFQRWMQSDELPTAEQIVQLVSTLSHGFDAEVEEYSQDSLQVVIRHFEDIGIRVHIEGKLPPEPLFAGTFVLIIREAVTNAVRHGLADRVFIDLLQNEKEYVLKVRNDGVQSEQELKYGNGLRIMEERLKAVGGFLSVEVTASFLLTAIIPREGAYDQSRDHR